MQRIFNALVVVLVAATVVAAASGARVGGGFMSTVQMENLIESRGFMTHNHHHLNVDGARCLGLRRGDVRGYSFHLFKCRLLMADDSDFTITAVATSGAFTVATCRIEYSMDGHVQFLIEWGGSRDCLKVL